jgi:tetratricopeptide (TPR) repeat protein
MMWDRFKRTLRRAGGGRSHDSSWTPSAGPTGRAAEQLRLANVLLRGCMNGRATGKLEDLNLAIFLYMDALRLLIEQILPTDRTMALPNPANFIWELPTRHRRQNFGRTIKAYESDLRVYTEQNCPAEWAWTMVGLANTYAKMPAGDRGENLLQAIEAYQAALRVYTEQAHPTHWAKTMHHLADAYRDLQMGDCSENLRRAIEGYRATLRVYTGECDLWQRLLIQRNLADIHFVEGDWAAALVYYEEGVKVAEQIYEGALSAPERRQLIEDTELMRERVVLCAAHISQQAKAPLEQKELPVVQPD